MGHVLIALDLGGGYGHLRRCLPLADALASRGHAVSFALRGSALATELLGDRPYPLHPAPVYTGPVDDRAPAENWADILLRTGYAVPGLLPALLRDWLALFTRLRPDLVVCDFAPTALLAARQAGLPCANLGSGFTPPPQQTPMPPTRPWAAVPPARLLASEAQALGIVNAALAGLGAAPLPTLADSLAADRVFLNCFPEFDHYGVREGSDYYGNDFALDAGDDPEWPRATGPRLFVYISAGARNARALLAALKASGIAALVHARGLPPGEAAALSGPALRVSARPLRMRAVLADCAGVICHSPGTAAAALLAGRPVALTPEHVEQAMVEYRLARQGLALGFAPSADEATCAAVLHRLLDDAAVANRAVGFARHYHGFTPAEAVSAMVDECDILLRGDPDLAPDSPIG